MKLITMPRGYGKTTYAIEASARKQIPILVHTTTNAKFILGKAEKLGLEIPTPITIEDLKRGSFTGREIIVDELGHVFTKLLAEVGFRGEVKFATITSTECDCEDSEESCG